MQRRALLLVPLVMLLALPLSGSASSWATLTVAGLAMGMLTFIMASGLTLIFGLMGVLTFAHGAFITLGAYLALTLAASPGPDWGIPAAIVGAMAAAALVGALFERVIIKPVYGDHTRQILITVGAMVVAEQLITLFWGANPRSMQLPAMLKGSFLIGDATFERYRLLLIGLGALLFAALHLLLNRTRLGLLIRAGVEHPEMVEALGYRITHVFVAVFALGSSLAALGGALWGLYRTELTPALGGERMIDIFIVVIIGGLGSLGGCFIAALLAALLFNYTSFFAPSLASLSEILLLVAVLLWRPQGLLPLGRG
jgi:branched-chain amino acid transport system permease protein